MRVGFNAALMEKIRKAEGLSCLDHISATFQEVLSERHEVVLFPSDYYQASASRRDEMAEHLVKTCDVILSQADYRLLSARARLDAPVPLCMLLMGSMPRGFRDLQRLGGMLRASDVLVANCTADVAIAAEVIENARVRLLPFAYREQVFYPPSEREVAAIRPWVGLPAEGPVVLYAGRHTLEKNVHTVLKVFSIVQAAVPHAHLVLAGRVDNVGFAPYGVFPLDLSVTLPRIIQRLGLGRHVHVAGEISPENLRALYGAADVVVNLSLHHDENFGLAQVEAMACGKPVVGTRWGGLQDTVAHGEAGYQVSTTLTEHGVKSNWWEAANRIVGLLRDAELRTSFGERALEIAAERYSPTRQAQELEAILEEAVHAPRSREPLRSTAFAREYWDASGWGPELLPPARRGPAERALYQRMIWPYTGTAPDGVAADEPLSPGQVVLLAHPVSWNADGTLAVHDAQFPFDVRVPDQVGHAVRLAEASLARQPVTTVGALMGSGNGMPEALAWMLEAGLVLRADPGLDAVDPALVRDQASKPTLSIRRVEHPADIIYAG